MFDTPQPGNVEDIFSGTADSPTGNAPVALQSPEQDIPVSAAPNASPPAPAGPQPMLEAGTSAGKRLILILAIVLLLALAGGTAYWYFRISKVERPTPSEGAPAEANLPEQSAPAPQEPAPTPAPFQEPQAPAPAVTPEPPATPPLPLDSDHDGLSDKEEASLGTDANNVDSDFDGLFDFEEVNVYKTSPMNADSDGDGYPDGVEIKNGFDPNGSGKLQTLPAQ